MSVRYTIIDKIATIRVCCNKILPTTYGESLSYMEQIAKVAYKLDEVINATNGLNDNVDALNDAVIEFGDRLFKVENEIDGFENEVNQRFNQLEVNVNKNVDKKLHEVDVAIDGINDHLEAIEQQQRDFEISVTSRITNLETSLLKIVNDEIAYLNELYQIFETDMRGYVDEQIQRIIDSIPDLTNVNVVDPTTGETVKIQIALNNIFIYSSHFAFTVDEYNKLNLTANDLTDITVNSIPRGLTIYEWLSKGKQILLTWVEPSIAKFFAYPHSIVKQFLTGEDVWHDVNVNVNQQLIAVSGGYSCDELNTMMFTCDEVNAFGISCYEFIMRANSIMIRE